jgi:hypothetical protein
MGLPGLHEENVTDEWLTESLLSPPEQTLQRKLRVRIVHSSSYSVRQSLVNPWSAILAQPWRGESAFASHLGRHSAIQPVGLGTFGDQGLLAVGVADWRSFRSTVLDSSSRCPDFDCGPVFTVTILFNFITSQVIEQSFTTTKTLRFTQYIFLKTVDYYYASTCCE